ncbi:MAG: SDR family NAD(P)-dependent oxidoreductase [Nitrospinota bacterium]|nr:SDR family NAD(P)-dependent oxidoreductase [Nitrospinota bacterium]MDH5677585.1 SDR family NAD(P)-dependent oxidoreductase [Nitrospinota bacterium]
MNTKFVMVTGCSSGIGLCSAKTLLQRGYRVIATARKEEDIRMLKDLGMDTVRLELAESQSVTGAAAAALDISGGTVFALVNNAAFGMPGAVEDLTRAAIREQFEVNLFGAMELTNLLIPSMRAAGEGRIVMVSSMLGFLSIKYQGAYNASKHAMEGLTDTLRMELADTGIKVSLVEPGPIRSRIQQNAVGHFKKHVDESRSLHQARYKKMARSIQEGREAPFTRDPEVVAAKIVHALESSRPKIRYLVTPLAHMFGIARRFFPAFLIDRLLARR